MNLGHELLIASTHAQIRGRPQQLHGGLTSIARSPEAAGARCASNCDVARDDTSFQKRDSLARPKSAVALGLTFSAGYVDVVGYLGLYHVFTANMTGNTVHFARMVVQGRGADGALAGFVIAAFLVGSVLGRTIIEAGARHNVRRLTSPNLALEAGFLTAAILVGQATRSSLAITWMLVVLAGAMGLQTATLTRIGPLTVHTTFVTGMLNKLAQLVSHAAFLSYDVLRGREHQRAARRQSLRKAAFIFCIWLLYLAGAAAGAGAHSQFGFPALVIPIVLLIAALFVEQVRPLSLQEEKDEP